MIILRSVDGQIDLGNVLSIICLGAMKSRIKTQLTFGVITIFSDQLLKLVS
jgi:hypothetical protein